MIWALLVLVLTPPLLSENERRALQYWNAVAAERGEPGRTEEAYAAQLAEWKKESEAAERQRLAGAGFEPAEAIRREGRSVIRATFTEPRLFLRMPGVTLERLADGRTRLTLSSDGRAGTGSAILPKETAAELQALEAEAFIADTPAHANWKPGDPVKPIDPPPSFVCHGWGTVLERITPANAEKVWGHGCHSQRAQPRLAYAERLAWAAIDAFPQCAGISPMTDSLSGLGQCLGKFEPSSSDNP